MSQETSLLKRVPTTSGKRGAGASRAGEKVLTVKCHPIAAGAQPAPRHEDQAFFMRRIKGILLGSVLVAGLVAMQIATAQVATAQVRSDSTVSLPGIVVVDSLAADSPDRAVRLRFIGPERLRSRVAESVADLLSSESFLFIPRAGLSGLATASLRGFGSLHTHVYLDGLLLADPQTGQVDLTTLPAVFFESVSVGHGGAAAEGGHGALGGSVRLETIRPGGRPSLRLLGSVGAFGALQGGFAASRPVNGVRMLLAANISSTDGSFLYEDQVRFPSVVTRREGSDRSSRNLYGRAEGESGVGKWFVSLWLADMDRGVPGPSNAPPVPARQEEGSLRIWAGSRIPIFAGRLQFAVMASRGRLRYVHPEPSVSTDSKTSVLDLSVTGYRVITESWLVDFGIRGGFDRTGLRGGTHQIRSLAYLSAAGIRQKWSLNPGVTAEFNTESGATIARLIPRFSARLKPVDDAPVALKGSISRVFRVPTFNERFWLPGGNPNLKPEEGWSADIGMSAWTGSDGFSARAEVTAHWSRLEDKVVWIPGLAGPSVQVWRPRNVGLVAGRGFESSVDIEFSPGPRFSVGARLIHAYSRVEDRTDESTRSYRRQIRYVPEHLFKWILRVRCGDVGVELLSSITGRRYVTSDESRYLAGHQVVSARTHATVKVSSSTIRLVGSIENLTDRPYEHIRFYPMPGRHARFSVVYDFGRNDRE